MKKVVSRYEHHPVIHRRPTFDVPSIGQTFRDRLQTLAIPDHLRKDQRSKIKDQRAKSKDQRAT
jgi:hypothetical protein